MCGGLRKSGIALTMSGHGFLCFNTASLVRGACLLVRCGIFHMSICLIPGGLGRESTLVPSSIYHIAQNDPYAKRHTGGWYILLLFIISDDYYIFGKIKTLISLLLLGLKAKERWRQKHSICCSIPQMLASKMTNQVKTQKAQNSSSAPPRGKCVA